MSVKTFSTEVLTSADTNTYLANSGLVYVSQSAFTAISTGSPLELDGLFSSTYDNYRIELEWIQNTTTSTMNIRLRSSAGNVSTNYGFTSGGTYYNAGVGTFAGYNNSAAETENAGYVMGVVATYRGVASYDIFSPNLARETNFMGTVSTSNSSATLTRVNVQSFIRQTASTVCVGLQLFPTSGTATGTLRVYGYRQA